jgi:hypothetical protein
LLREQGGACSQRFEELDCGGDNNGNAPKCCSHALWPNASIAGKKGEEVTRDLFQKICWFSILLRQVRVVLDCFSLAEGGPEQDAWNRFLAGVPLAEQVRWMNLFKNVLAVQSGGRSSPFRDYSDLARSKGLPFC